MKWLRKVPPTLYQSGIERLAVEPDNARSNSVVGLYEILINNRMRKGLEHLDASDDPRLKEIRRLEPLLFPTDEEVFALGGASGGAWWGLAENLDGRTGTKARELSHFSYEQCFEKLTGVDKILAKKRIEEFLDGDKIPYVANDLLRPDLKRSVHHGEMKPEIGELLLTSARMPSSCQFFQRLSDDYDLTYVFTRSHVTRARSSEASTMLKKMRYEVVASSR